MGVMSFNRGDTVYVDAQVVVYPVEKRPSFSALCDQIWLSLAAGDINAVTSELTLLECQIVPFRNKDHQLVQQFEQFLAQPALSTAAVSIDILRSPASLRAGNVELKTPDAIHIASATERGCSVIVTNDREWVGYTRIPVLALAELIP